MKLNLGAGGTRIDGFTSVDVDPELRPDIAGDFRLMSFAGVEEIYASHLLEHFFYNEAEKVLRQWCGWLKPGGTLWLAVPDFEQIARLYAAGEHSPHLLGLLFGASAKPEWAHHSGWTEAYLIATLEAAGFTVRGRFEPFAHNPERTGTDWSGAWHRTREGQDVRVSLNLQCQKRQS